MALNSDYFINYKEFIEWFMLSKIFTLIRNSSDLFHSNLEGLVQGFNLLGLRISKYNLEQSQTRFDV